MTKWPLGNKTKTHTEQHKTLCNGMITDVNVDKTKPLALIALIFKMQTKNFLGVACLTKCKRVNHRTFH